MFVMVVDEGSFAAAARKIGRATSVVSYSIARLEAQLGASLFTRVNTRKPQLTEAGRTVLGQAQTIIADVIGLSAKVRDVGKVFGRKIHFDTVDAMRVRNGKITEHWGVAILFSLMQQLRAIAPDKKP